MDTDSTISVLLVDDDPLVLAATARLLKRHGMRSTCASSPFGVTALVRKEGPDAIVLDYRMPGLDGAHLVRVLRTSPRTSKIPVVFYSGDPDDALLSTAQAIGAQCVIKGGTGVGLVEAIRSLVASHRAETAAAS